MIYQLRLDDQDYVSSHCDPHFYVSDPPQELTIEEMLARDKAYVTKQKMKTGEMLQETRGILVDLFRPHMEELAHMLKDDRFLWKDVSFGS